MAPPGSKPGPGGIPLSPGAKLDDSTVILQLQQFMDEWNFCVVESCMAKHWDRKDAVRTALDLLHMNGAKFPTQEYKDSLLIMDEDVMVSKLVDCIPMEMREHLDETLATLQSAFNASTSLRKAVDDKDEECVLAGIEVADGARGIEAVLRNCVLLASTNVVKVRRVHASWRENTEARIARLERATEDADNCTRQLMAVEAQLDDFGGNSKANAKNVLMGLAAKNEKALMSSAFSAWLGCLLKSQAASSIRSKYQKQLADAEAKLYAYKERQIACVRGVMGRTLVGEGDNLASTIIRFWKKQVEEAKHDGDTKQAINAAKARLEKMKSAQTQAAKKVLITMSQGSSEGLVTMAFQGWIQFSEDYKKDKEFEDAVKAAETKLTEQMDAKKEQTMRIMERMQSQSEAGLNKMCWSAWWQAIAETKKSRVLQAKLDESSGKFQSLKERQCGNARNVQGRINEQMKQNIMLKCFSYWHFDTKTEKIESMFSRKLESKRRQLAGVQNMFRTFAAQLESGLGNDGGDSSRDTTARTHGSAMSKPKTKRQNERRDTSGSRGEESVSLPDIHQGRRPIYA